MQKNFQYTKHNFFNNFFFKILIKVHLLASPQTSQDSGGHEDTDDVIAVVDEEEDSGATVEGGVTDLGADEKPSQTGGGTQGGEQGGHSQVYTGGGGEGCRENECQNYVYIPIYMIT